MDWRAFDGARAASGTLSRRSWAALGATLIAAVLLFSLPVSAAGYATSTTVTVSPNPASASDTVTVEIVVRNTNLGDVGVTQGDVELFIDGMPSGRLTLDASAAGATRFVSSLSPGMHTIFARYLGTSTLDPSDAAPLSLVVNPSSAVGASISFTPATLGVGSTGTMTIAFTNPNSFASPDIAPTLAVPALVTLANGLPGGTCGASATIGGNTVNFNAFSIPPSGCTVVMNFTGTTAGSTSGFVLSAFTPAGWPTTPATAGSGFRVVPIITGLSPAMGPVSQVVTISGAGFSTTPSNNTVMFGTTQALVTAASATSLTVTAPSSGAGTVPVTVTVNGQVSTDSVSYTFQAPPVASNLNGVAVPYNSSGTAIDLTSSITGAVTSIVVGAAPAHGTVAIAGNVIFYTPTAGYFGTDSFVYTATGPGGTSAPAVVSLMIATPTPPVASNRSGVAVPYNSSGTAIDLTSSITGAVTSIAVGTAPAHGTVVIAGNVIFYTPTAGYFGTDSFTYTATGPGGTSTPAVVSLTIATPTRPVVADRSGVVVPYNSSGTVIDLSGSITGIFIRIDIDRTAAKGTLSVSAGSVVTYTPTAGAVGVDNFTYTAIGPGGTSAPATVSLTIASPTISINSPGVGALPAATGGTAYSQAFTATGGQGPHRFTIASGSLPAGLRLTSAGILSGAPTEAGAFDFTLTATDSTPAGDGGPFTSAPVSYSLTVNAPAISLSPAAGALPGGSGGTAYSQTITATGGNAPYGFSVSAGALPAGLSLNADGKLSGTPGEAGNFNLTVTAKDADGFAGEQAYTLAISAPVPTARSMSVDLLAGTSATVNLTIGASGGPFTAAAIVAAPAAANGTASVTGNGGAYELTFAASATATGAVAVSYTLSNKWGVSVPATITFNVAARPDPAKDREVTGLVTAQADAARRFATAQIRNFNGRLEQLHNEGNRRTGSANIQLGVTRPKDARRPLPYAEDSTARSGTTLGFPMDRLTGNKDASAGDGGNTSAAAFWAGGFVNFGQRDNGGIDLKQTLAGVSGGVDYRFSPRFVGGIGFGYGRDSADIGDNGTRSRAQAISIAAYGSYSPVADFFIDGLLGYSRLDFGSRRFVTDTGDFADGRRGGQQLFGSLTAAYEDRQDGWLLSPYGRLELSRSRLDAFAEAGAGPYNLAFGGQSLSTVAGVLGLRAEYAVPMSWGVLTPRARLEYTHDFSGSSRASMGYADLGNGLPYGFDIDPLSRDHLGLGLGFDIGLDNGWLFGFDYGTALGTDGKTQEHTLGAKIGARW